MGGGHRRHDALQQYAVRRIIANRLVDRNEPRPGPIYHAAGRPVILLVSGPAVDLPDNDVIDVLRFTNIGNQLSKYFALDEQATRKAGLNVLAYHLSVQTVGLAGALLTLRGQAQPSGS